ncbi:MAG: TIGR01459 family HAD-type hydrolase [Rhodoblastus sp.]|nr:MAG: TIGR01459 family HAD-type hydrolase [Rhodoblastus sp.]
MTDPTSHGSPGAVPAESALPAPSPGFRAIAARYRVLLCDVWGVVHDGVKAFPEACAALERHRAAGGVVVLITNAPRPSGPLYATLEGYGAPRSCYDTIVSSGDVTLDLMAERGGGAVHFIGPERDLSLFPELAAQTGAAAPANVAVSQADYSVLSGLRDDEVETPADYEDELQAMRARGLDAICANPDIVVHRGDRLIYCGGALAARYEALGGRVSYAGKPYSPIYAKAQAAARAQRARGLPQGGAVLCLGDAIHTDVAGARKHGFDCLFVIDGIHRDRYTRPDGSIDEAALERCFAEQGPARPTAMMRKLVW